MSEWRLIDHIHPGDRFVDLTRVPPLRDPLNETQRDIEKFCDEYRYLPALWKFAWTAYPGACRRLGCRTTTDAALVAALYGWTMTKLIGPLSAIRQGQPCPVQPPEAKC